MALQPAEIEQAALASLSEEERSRAVVYLDERILQPGDEIEVNGGRVRVDAHTTFAFADLEPGVNWGHRCRYLLVALDSGEVRAIDAQFPPFLHGPQPGLKVVHRAPTVPDWAIGIE